MHEEIYVVVPGFGSITRIEDNKPVTYMAGDQVVLSKAELVEVGHMVRPLEESEAQAAGEPRSGAHNAEVADEVKATKKGAKKAKNGKKGKM